VVNNTVRINPHRTGDQRFCISDLLALRSNATELKTGRILLAIDRFVPK